MQGDRAYITSNRPNGTLHVGVTEDLARRDWQRRQGTGSEFVRKYGLTRLVHAERHKEIVRAIQRETSMKDGPRAWKMRLIHAMNPDWPDLFERLYL